MYESPNRCQTFHNRNRNSPSYFHRVGAKPLQHAPLGTALAAAARRWPARPAVVAREEQVTLTYEQLLEQVLPLFPDSLFYNSVTRNRVPLDNFGVLELRISKTGASTLNSNFGMAPRITSKSLGTPRDSS
ncbi:hypothetical protein EVAR_81979_1 [Eumeta japonica]|uniref:Uncharacterized protein n=1 Tax=Eumeta variegata TaxID=151549 RepID=A0A4C1VWD7_EUMVA|nr:hypothetical protein EVAR_81979_1 [Eumeta japonica]